jgi:hypothetical protein
MAEITYQMVVSTLQTIALIVGIAYYLTIMRNTQRTRELSLKAQEEAEKARQRELIFQRFQGYSLEYTRAFADVRSYTDWEDVDDWHEKYGILSNPEAWSEYAYITSTYNLAGILLKEEVADAELIFQLYPPQAVIRIWERFEPVTLDVRERTKHTSFYGPFEFLYNEAKKMYPHIIVPDIP